MSPGIMNRRSRKHPTVLLPGYAFSESPRYPQLVQRNRSILFTQQTFSRQPNGLAITRAEPRAFFSAAREPLQARQRRSGDGFIALLYRYFALLDRQIEERIIQNRHCVERVLFLQKLHYSRGVAPVVIAVRDETLSIGFQCPGID